MDFLQARKMMLEGQLRTDDILESTLLDAFYNVKREEFVPHTHRELSYADSDIGVEIDNDIAAKRYILRPRTLGHLLKAADIQKDEFVLDVGCATGYSTAILSLLCSSVVGLEQDETLCDTATHNLSNLDYNNTAIMQGHLEMGWPKDAPYDVIMLQGSVERVPQALIDQLKPGGRLICVLNSNSKSRITVFYKYNTHFDKHDVKDGFAPLLPGFKKDLEFTF